MNEINISSPTLNIAKKINRNDIYVIMQKGSINPIMTEKGSEIQKKYKVKQWVDFFNSGYFMTGVFYTVLKYVEGSKATEIVYQQAVTNRVNEDESKTDKIVPYNAINERTNMKQLADSLNQQSTMTVTTLQDELQRKDNYVQGLHEQMNEVYTQLATKDQYYYTKQAELQDKISELTKENERLKVELANEKWKIDFERKMLNEKSEFEKYQFKKEKDLAEKNSNFIGDTIKDLIPLATQFIPMFTGKSAIPTLQGLSNMPQINNKNKVDLNPKVDLDDIDIEYPEMELIK